MKRRQVQLEVSDHAVLRWLERAHGIDLEPVRSMIAGKTMNAAELGAAAVCIDSVRYVLRDVSEFLEGDRVETVVTTTLKLDQRRGIGLDNGQKGRRA